MRAVIITEPGGLDVLKVADRPARDAGAGEVRIAVKAAAVNPTDIGLRQRGGGDLPAPWVPGMDAAGVVESVGPEVERLERRRRGDGRGQPAAARGWRAAGAAGRAGSPRSCRSPTAPRWSQAATLPMNGLTARSGLELLGLKEGETLAVTGGAGLLASYVIPLAKEHGLRVIADAKPEDEELVRSFGADVVVPRGQGFTDAVLEAVPDGVDGLYDTALLRRAAFPAIRDGGQIVVVRGWDGDEVEDRGIRVHPVAVARVLDRTDWLEELRTLASDGRIKLRVAAEFPPEQAAEARAPDGRGRAARPGRDRVLISRAPLRGRRGRVVARDAADAAAPARAGAAQPHVRVRGLDAPRADLFV